MKKKLLISGFEPFDGLVTNPSQLLIASLVPPPHVLLEKIILPVEFIGGFEVLAQKIDQFSPDIIICTGVARGGKSIFLEQKAVNRMEGKIPDNKGHSPFEKCVEEGPNELFSTLPLQHYFEKWRGQYPLELSSSAGTYVCNDVMYRMLRKTQQTDMRGAFIHIPMTTELDPHSSVALSVLTNFFSDLISYLGEQNDF